MVWELIEKDPKALVNGFYASLSAGNVEKTIAFLAKDVVLEWGPFRFEGEDGIRQWAKELKQMFPEMTFSETNLIIEGSRVTQSLLARVTVSDGRRGILPVTGVYELEDGRLRHVTIALSPGLVLLSKDKVESLGT